MPSTKPAARSKQQVWRSDVIGRRQPRRRRHVHVHHRVVPVAHSVRATSRWECQKMSTRNLPRPLMLIPALMLLGWNSSMEMRRQPYLCRVIRWTICTRLCVGRFFRTEHARLKNVCECSNLAAKHASMSLSSRKRSQRLNCKWNLSIVCNKVMQVWSRHPKRRPQQPRAARNFSSSSGCQQKARSSRRAS